jgi:hypothetical protein
MSMLLQIGHQPSINTFASPFASNRLLGNAARVCIVAAQGAAVAHNLAGAVHGKDGQRSRQGAQGIDGSSQRVALELELLCSREGNEQKEAVTTKTIEATSMSTSTSSSSATRKVRQC